jgi:phage shock protein A
MTNTKTEQKITEIVNNLETEKIYVPPFGYFIKEKLMETYLKDLKSIATEELSELSDIKNMKEQIILDAQADGERIRQEARSEVERQDVVLQAREVAKEVIQKSQSKAESTLLEAKELRNQLIVNTHKYVDNLFDDLEKELVEKKEKISSNREVLRSSLDKKMELMQESPN